MLSTLFRPKWQHNDPQVRQQAIAALQPGKDNSTLLTIALNDNNSAVRHAAISRIEQLDSLRQLHGQTSHSADKSFILQCWCNVLGNNDLTPPLQAESQILDCTDPHWLAAIASYCENASLQELALTGLRDEAVIFQLLTDSRHSRLWQALVQQLHSEESLKKAAALVKGRDKKATQLIRQQLDELNKQQQHQQQLQQHAAHILEKLQQLINSEHTPLMEGILLNLHQQFQALPQETPQHAEIEQALQQCQQKLQQQQQAEALQQQHNALVHDAEQLLKQLTTTLESSDNVGERINQLQQQQTQNPQLRRVLSEARQLHDTLTALHQQQAIHNPLTAASLNTLNSQQHSEWLEDVSKAIVLCQRHPALKARYLAGLQQQEALLKKQAKQQQGQQQQNVQQLEDNIEKADNAIADSDFATVQRLYQTVRKQLDQLSHEQRKPYQPALQRMQAATQALHDWKNFATDPKRDALCEAMEKLITADIAPAEKASRIKQLHEQWKALGFCQDQAVWQRFRELSEQAYAPCKQYFDEQKQKKTFNAEQRGIICEQLETFVENLDWAHCDYRSIEKLYRSIDAEWQKYALLEHKDYKTLQARYSNAMLQIKNKLQQEKQKNTDALQQIVQQAQALLQQDDANEALNQYQLLHEQWRHIGISFHKTQQALWQQLREAGDALYQKRSQQRNDAEEVLQANLQNARLLIEQLKTCNNASETDAIRQQFEQLGSLPKHSEKKIRTDFQQALQQAQQLQKARQQQAFYQQLTAVRQWADHSLQQEQNQQPIASPPNEWPAAWQQISTQRSNSTADETAARMLCIELEMLTEQASPESDAALRRELHMQQLAEHFGNAARSSFSERFTDIYLRWSALPGGRITNYPTLALRFYTIADTIISG